MKVNFGFFINKLIKLAYRPALRDCEIDKTARIGMASNCIRVKMGRYSYMGCFNSVCDVKIGSFCSIASYCAIGGGKHPIDSVSTAPVFYAGRNSLGRNFAQRPEEKNKGIEIGDDVWIGESVFIKDGVTIGTGAIIGAHSVVTKDIPQYAIAAGVPAKVLRYRFDKVTIEKLLASKWWEWPEEKIHSMADCFGSIEVFLKEVDSYEDSSFR